MTAWATAHELKERVEAAYQLYLDACDRVDDTASGYDRGIMRKSCEARLKTWERLRDRHAKAVAREHKGRHRGRA